MPRPRKTARQGRRETSLLGVLTGRSLTGNPRTAKLWAEDSSVMQSQLEHVDLDADATVSTISMDFSNEGKLLASTHGDHSVKITNFSRGRVVQTLRGHPRTPWSVKFHPKDSNIVASGCLGCEVRIWNISTGQCLRWSRVDIAVVSLSFHPSGHMLAVAGGHTVYLWDYLNKPSPYVVWSHAHTLRCVRFTPDGAGMIIGAATNGHMVLQGDVGDPGGSARMATGDAANGAAGGSMAPAVVRGRMELTFQLILCDFSHDAALAEHRAAALTRPRELLHRALLYNDASLDVSEDGLWLCVVADLWKTGIDRAARPARPSPTKRAGDGASTATPEAEAAAAAAAAVAAAAAAAANDAPRDGFVRSTAGAASTEALTVAADRGDDTPLTTISGEQRPMAVPAAGLRVKTGVRAGRRETSLRRWRGQGDSPRADVGTKPQVTGVGDEVEGAKVPIQQWKKKNAVTASACEKSGDMERGLSAPRRGSQLGQGKPLTVGMTAAATPSLPQAILAKAGRGTARGVAGGDNSGRPRQAERGKCPGGGGASLAPWPSRMRSRCNVSDAGEYGAWGRHVDGSGVVVTGPAGVGEGVGDELPPKTPSPPTNLKRRLSSPCSDSTKFHGGSGSDGILGRKRQETETDVVGRVPEASRTARQESGEAGVGDGSSSGDVDGNQNVRYLPVSSESRAVLLRPAREGNVEQSPPRHERGGGSAVTRQERGRPHYSPSPIDANGSLSFCSSSSSWSSSTLLLRTPPSRSAPWLSEELQTSSQLLLATSQGRGRPFSPQLPAAPLLEPATAAAATATADGDRVHLQAGAEREREMERREEGELEQRGNADPSPRPPPPIFFLQVPGTVAASRRVQGLSPPLFTPTAEAPVDLVGEAGEGNTAQRRGNQRCPGLEGERGGRGIGTSSVTETGWFEQSSDGYVPRITSDDRGRHVRLPPSPLLRMGKFVPHLVLVSLNMKADGSRAARVVRKAPMDSLTAKQVASVKFSPSARYILLGAERTHPDPWQAAFADGLGGGSRGGGVGGSGATSGGGSGIGGGGGGGAPRCGLTTSIYSASDLRPVNLMRTADSGINIACFHPEPGVGCAYGTKQGRVGLVRTAY